MRAGHVAARLAILAACACIAACASSLVRPSLPPSKPGADALPVLPGFGYSRGGENTFRSLAASMAAEGVDLYVPTYVSRSGLIESRAKLQRFIRDHRLDRYDHLHVFAFIAGAWTLNPLVETAPDVKVALMVETTPTSFISRSFGLAASPARPTGRHRPAIRSPATGRVSGSHRPKRQRTETLMSGPPGTPLSASVSDKASSSTRRAM